MITLRNVLRLTAVTMVAYLASCGGLGKVNQGQVIEFDKSKGVITLISDSNARDPANPRFDVLPPVVVQAPANPDEMGPLPEAGKLMSLDAVGRKMVVFDAASQTLRTLPYEAVSQQEDVARDDPRVAGKHFPIVDRNEQTITLYWRARRLLLTFKAPAGYLALPEDTWRTGDVVRYYYKDPRKALRVMNVSKTDLQKAGE